MPSVSYSRFADEVLEVYRLKATATACKMRQVLREFGEVDGVRRVTDLRPAVIARWIGKFADARAPETNRSLLRSMRSACSIAVASGYLRVSPFAVRIDVPDRDEDPDSPAKARHHTQAQLGAVLALAAEEAAGFDWQAGRLECLLALCAYAALRRNEALYLRRRDVDLAAGVLRVAPCPRNPRLKTRASAAAVPLAPPLAELLDRWLPRARSEWVVPNVSRSNPWTGGPKGHKPLDRVKALGRRAGVEGLTMQSLRHSFATHAASWGIGELSRQAILRHTTVRTAARHYTHEDLPYLVAAVRNVRYAAAPEPPARSAAV